jgi:hypothetical protein
MSAQQGKMDDDLRTSSSLGTLFITPYSDYFPIALEDGGRLAPMAVDLVDRLVILVACMGAAVACAYGMRHACSVPGWPFSKLGCGGLSLFTVLKLCPHEVVEFAKRSIYVLFRS